MGLQYPHSNKVINKRDKKPNFMKTASEKTGDRGETSKVSSLLCTE